MVPSTDPAVELMNDLLVSALLSRYTSSKKNLVPGEVIRRLPDDARQTLQGLTSDSLNKLRFYSKLVGQTRGNTL